MELFCKFLGLTGVKWHNNSSERCSTRVPGAIVKPATHGNHLVGHATDGNPIDAGGRTWSSLDLEIYAPHSKLFNYNARSGSIYELIKYIRNSNVLRWGGDFFTPDTVHIDDGLNVSNPARWQQIYDELHPKPIA